MNSEVSATNNLQSTIYELHRPHDCGRPATHPVVTSSTAWTSLTPGRHPQLWQEAERDDENKHKYLASSACYVIILPDVQPCCVKIVLDVIANKPARKCGFHIPGGANAPGWGGGCCVARKGARGRDRKPGGPLRGNCIAKRKTATNNRH